MSDELVILCVGFHTSNDVAFWDLLFGRPGAARIGGPYELSEGLSSGVEKTEAFEVCTEVDEHANIANISTVCYGHSLL